MFVCIFFYSMSIDLKTNNDKLYIDYFFLVMIHIILFYFNNLLKTCTYNILVPANIKLYCLIPAHLLYFCLYVFCARCDI